MLRQKAQAAVLAALRAFGGEAHRNEIVARALADGDFTERELLQPAPDETSGLVAYKLSFALGDLKHNGLLDNPTRGTWVLTDVAAEAARPATKGEATAERLTELRSMPYRRYLQTPEWRRTRAAALLRAGGACSMDITHTEGLEVHHRTYDRRGAELASDIVVLCHACHRLHHNEYGRPRRQRKTATPALPALSGAVSVDPAVRHHKPSLIQRLLRALRPGAALESTDAN